MAEEQPNQPVLPMDQREAVDFITKLITASVDKTAGVVILRIAKDGHVHTYAGSTILNPPDLVKRIADQLAGIAQDLFVQAVTKGNSCNCEKCQASRASAPMFGGPTAQA